MSCVCGLTWQEPRLNDEPMQNSATCPHRNTDHRGSTKDLMRTFCKDCNSYIDAAPREVALAAARAREQAVTPEERELLNRVPNNHQITRAQIVEANRLMQDNTSRIEEGSFNVQDIVNMYIDCVDAAKAQAPTAFVQTHVDEESDEEKDPKLLINEDCQNTVLEIVDPLESQHIFGNCR